MAQATFSVRMDEGLKEQFDELCQAFGMSITTAINVFARAVVRERRIPFEITAQKAAITRMGALEAFSKLRSEAEASGLGDLSLEEINREISAVRGEGNL